MSKSLHLHGVNPYAVISAIKSRHERRCAGDYREDGRKIALVIEGGAMRAVCSAGGAVALAELGFSDLFDEVYATSAGVMNASYFITNQPQLGISVYFDNCTTRAFFNPLRFWKVLDVDYIIDMVVSVQKPLDVDKVLRSQTRLMVTVIDHITGQPRIVDTKTTRTPLLDVLKAAMAIPIFYNRTIEVDGRRCIDAGLAMKVAIKPALAAGCTDVLVLATRPADYADLEPSWASKFMFNLIFARGNEAINTLFNHHHVHSREAYDIALGRVSSLAGVNIATICADASENIDRITVDRSVLHRVAVSYGRRVFSVFGVDARRWTLPRAYQVDRYSSVNCKSAA